MHTLAHAPAVVAAGFDDVQLLVAPVPDVTHQEPPVATGLPGQAPWVPEPQGEDLCLTASVDEWVVRRDRVWLVSVDIEPQDLAEQSRWILGIAARGVADVRIASPTAVARSEVEKAVRPEAESPATVVRLRLAEPQDHALRGGINAIALRIGVELAEDVVVVVVRARGGRRVVHEQPTVLGEGRMELHAEQAPFVVLGIQPDEPIGQVQVRVVDELAVAQHEDQAGLVDDEGRVAIAAGGDQSDWCHQAVRDEIETDVRGWRA